MGSHVVHEVCGGDGEIAAEGAFKLLDITTPFLHTNAASFLLDVITVSPGSSTTSLPSEAGQRSLLEDAQLSKFALIPSQSHKS